MMTLERKKNDKGCVPDIWPEALGEEMKARFFVCLGFMRPAHVREEVVETWLLEGSRCTGEVQEVRWKTTIGG